MCFALGFKQMLTQRFRVRVNVWTCIPKQPNIENIKLILCVSVQVFASAKTETTVLLCWLTDGRPSNLQGPSTFEDLAVMRKLFLLSHVYPNCCMS